MKNHILTYNQLNESNEFDDLSFEEVGRLAELGLIDNDLLKIYNYVKNGNIGDLDLQYSKLEYLPNWLTKVNGTLNISHSDILEIPDSLIMVRSINAYYSKLKQFSRNIVYGNLNIGFTNITKLPNDLSVNGYLSVEGIQFEQFPKSLEIGAFYIAKSNLLQFTTEELREMYKIKYEIHRGI